MKITVNLFPDGVDEDGEPTFIDLDSAVAQQLHPIMERAVGKAVDSIKESTIRKAVEAKVATIVDAEVEQTFQRTDGWGTPRGDPKSLPDIVGDLVKTYLTTKVNSRGEPRYDGKTRVDAAAQQAVVEAVNAEMKDHLAALRKEFTEVLIKKMGKVTVG